MSEIPSDPLVVLGMHRSGTSFLIRALNLEGLWLGEDAALSTVEGRAMVGNPKGNYENRDAILINNTILAKSGGAWFNPPARLHAGEEEERKIRALCTTLERGRPERFPRWGWKDPRTLLTLEVWLRALGRPVFVVASYRHPTAVAQSLLSRDKIPLAVGYALWAHYNALLLRALDVLPHVLVRFDVAPQALIAQVVRACQLTGLRTDPGLIDAWHDPSLVRSNAQSDGLEGLEHLQPLWSALTERHRSHFPV